MEKKLKVVVETYIDAKHWDQSEFLKRDMNSDICIGTILQKGNW